MARMYQLGSHAPTSDHKVTEGWLLNGPLPRGCILYSNSQCYLFFFSTAYHFPGGSDNKAFAYSAGDLGSIPGSGRPGEGNDNPLEYSCLENPMDGGAWRATVHGSQRVGQD